MRINFRPKSSNRPQISLQNNPYLVSKSCELRSLRLIKSSDKLLEPLVMFLRMNYQDLAQDC